MSGSSNGGHSSSSGSSQKLTGLIPGFRQQPPVPSRCRARSSRPSNCASKYRRVLMRCRLGLRVVEMIWPARTTASVGVSERSTSHSVPLRDRSSCRGPRPGRSVRGETLPSFSRPDKDPGCVRFLQLAFKMGVSSARRSDLRLDRLGTRCPFMRTPGQDLYLVPIDRL